MTFTEFKKEIIDRQKRLEINQLLHLYIKCGNYIDVLKVIKQIADFDWSLANGLFDGLINEIPESDLNAEGFYKADVTLSNISTVYMISGALTLSMTGQNRCKVLLFGDSSLSAVSNDESMIEIESYSTSAFTAESKNSSYLHVTARNQSHGNILAKTDSVVKLNALDYSSTSIIFENDAFANIVADDNSSVVINSAENTKIVKVHGATITTVS